jgi:hypothetical protein
MVFRRNLGLDLTGVIMPAVARFGYLIADAKM